MIFLGLELKGSTSSKRLRLAFFFLLVLGGAVLAFAQNSTQPDTQPSVAPGAAYLPVLKFDPKRDATADIQAAIVEAQRTGKRILLDVGGDWCQYCHQMAQFFAEHSEILQLRDNNFITVAIYYGTDNKNPQALTHYSKVLGVPHFFVLEKDGTLLCSQHVLELRTGGKYDPEKIKTFFLKWSPPAESAALKP